MSKRFVESDWVNKNGSLTESVKVDLLNKSDTQLTTESLNREPHIDQMVWKIAYYYYEYFIIRIDFMTGLLIGI